MKYRSLTLKTVIKPIIYAVVWSAFILLSLETCYAGYSGPMRFSVFQPCSGNAPVCAPRILAEGRIEDDTAEKFSRFLKGKNKSPYNLPSKATVCFDSEGGSLLGAVDLGNKIRENRFDTCLYSTYRRVRADFTGRAQRQEIFVNEAACASACVLALAGGVNRDVGERARVGVHQFSNPGGSFGRPAASRTRYVAVAGYLELMGVKRTLLDTASLYRPDQMYWLSQKEISQSRLRTTNISVFTRR